MMLLGIFLLLMPTYPLLRLPLDQLLLPKGKIAPPAIARESVTDRFKASVAEMSVLASVSVGVNVAILEFFFTRVVYTSYNHMVNE